VIAIGLIIGIVVGLVAYFAGPPTAIDVDGILSVTEIQPAPLMPT
jgi:hypothetical protein